MIPLTLFGAAWAADLVVRPLPLDERLSILRGEEGGFVLDRRPAPAWVHEPGVDAVTGDFDADGTTDVAFRRPGVWTVLRILFDRGGVWVETSTPVSAQVNELGSVMLVGRFDTDADDDLAFVKPGGRWTNLPVLLSRRNGTFTAVSGAVPVSVHDVGAVVVAGDYDGDLDDDLIVHQPLGAWTTIVALTNKSGKFTASTPTVPWFVNEAGAVAHAGDFDDDGRTEFTFTHPTGGWSVLPTLSRTSGGAWVGYEPYGVPFVGEPGTEAVVGDFDGDGRDDLAFRNPEVRWETVPVAHGQGLGFWTEAELIAPAWAQDPTREVHVGDFDRDGDDDLALFRDGAEEHEEGDGDPIPVLYAQPFEPWADGYDLEETLLSELMNVEIVRRAERTLRFRLVDGGDPNYDASAGTRAAHAAAFEVDFEDLVFDNSGGIQIVPPPSWYDQVIDEVGFTGSYVGQVWNGAQTAHAFLQLVDVGGLALGYVHVLEDGIELDGGWCGSEPLPHVRFPITASTSGPVLYGLPTIDQYTAVGVTTRQASLFGVFGGTAVLSFELTLDVTTTHDSFLTASIDIDAPSPCDDQHLTGSFTRNNAALFEAFVIR